jgi:ketosteroid isomerase-like protein
MKILAYLAWLAGACTLALAQQSPAPAATRPPPPSTRGDVATAHDAAAITEAFKAWVNVCESGDAAGYLDYVTDEFVYCGPDQKPIGSKTAVSGVMTEFFEKRRFALPEWKTEQVLVAGDTALHRYTGTAVLTRKSDGRSVTQDRTYVDVLRKINGRWLVAVHSFELKPPPGESRLPPR